MIQKLTYVIGNKWLSSSRKNVFAQSLLVGHIVFPKRWTCCTFAVGILRSITIVAELPQLIQPDQMQRSDLAYFSHPPQIKIFISSPYWSEMQVLTLMTYIIL